MSEVKTIAQKTREANAVKKETNKVVETNVNSTVGNTVSSAIKIVFEDDE